MLVHDGHDGFIQKICWICWFKSIFLLFFLYLSFLVVISAIFYPLNHSSVILIYTCTPTSILFIPLNSRGNDLLLIPFRTVQKMFIARSGLLFGMLYINETDFPFQMRLREFRCRCNCSHSADIPLPLFDSIRLPYIR